jgi:hypothetical protein
MIITANTKLSQEFTTGEGVTFTVSEHANETHLMITWANGEDALDYCLRITNNDAHGIKELFGVVN